MNKTTYLMDLIVKVSTGEVGMYVTKNKKHTKMVVSDICGLMVKGSITFRWDAEKSALHYGKGAIMFVEKERLEKIQYARFAGVIIDEFSGLDSKQQKIVNNCVADE